MPMMNSKTHKSQHKDGCRFAEYSRMLHRHNQNRSEETLSISDEGIEYENDDRGPCGEPDETILFKFCPLCGCPYEINEDIEEE